MLRVSLVNVLNQERKNKELKNQDLENIKNEKNVPKAQITITCFNRETNKYNFHSLIDYGFCKLQMSSDSFYKIDEIKEWIKLSQ